RARPAAVPGPSRIPAGRSAAWRYPLSLQSTASLQGSAPVGGRRNRPRRAGFQGENRPKPGGPMRLSRTALSSFGTLALVVLSVPPAGARERFGGKHLPPRGSEQRTVTRTGVNGQSHTWTQNSTWQRGNGAWSRDTTTTNPQGKTWNTQVTGAKTADGFVRD